MKSTGIVILEAQILREIKTVRREIKTRLCDTSLSAREWESLQAAFCNFKSLEREARNLLQPAKRDDVMCGRVLDYEEIPLDKLDEVVTDEYCEEELTDDFCRKRNIS